LSAKVLRGPGKCRRRNFPGTEDLPTEFDNDRVGRVEPVRVEPMLDYFDDVAGDAFAERLGFMRCPFELTIELTGGDQNGQFANASSEPRFVSQIAIERPGMPRELGTMEKIPPGPLRPLSVPSVG
jgi:hypothetical protein